LREQLDEINDGIKHLQVALLNLSEPEAKNTEAPKILTNSSVGWLKRPPQDWLVLFIMF
jgi:hypothetical protein